MIKEQKEAKRLNDIQGSKLKETFRKNGIDYRLLDRTNKTALFEQKLPTGEMAGYEVSIIQFNKARIIAGINISSSESIPSDERFGMENLKWGSRAFFPNEIIRAKQYFRDLNYELFSKIAPTGKDLSPDLSSAVS